MLTIRYEKTFKKDYKRIIKRGYDIKLLKTVIELLATSQPLPEKYKDHSLTGNYLQFRECHISNDWLLIYKIDSNTLILTAVRTGTHSDLF